MTESEETSEQKWLDTYVDEGASLHTFTPCIDFIDLAADHDRKLILADFGQDGAKLRVYKGMLLVAELPLVTEPSAVLAMYTESEESPTPVIAVASVSSVYLYRNLKPFYRYTLPELEINSIEKQIWDSVASGNIEPLVACKALETLSEQVNADQLTFRSSYCLSLAQEEQRTAFVAQLKDEPLSRRTVITCATTLKKSLRDAEAEDYLVLCTENRMVHVLDCHVFKLLRSLQLPDVGSMVYACGLYDVDYHVVVCCRDGCVYTVRRTTKTVDKPTVVLGYRAVGLTRVGKSIVVGTMDNVIRYFTFKGRKLYQRKLPANIVTMNKLEYSLRNFEAAIVSLRNRSIHVFNAEAALVDLIQLDSVAMAVKFGKFGREEGALVINTENGALRVKLLKRNCKLESRLQTSPASAQRRKLPIPKKSKLAVDQAAREREQFKDMHHQFQVDMLRLRIKTAEAYEAVLRRKLAPTAAGSAAGTAVKLCAQVFGFGPQFLLEINLNSFSTETLYRLCMCATADPGIYLIAPCTFTLPAIRPKKDYRFKLNVTVVSKDAVSDEIIVSIYSGSETRPLLTTAVKMPIAGKDI